MEFVGQKMSVTCLEGEKQNGFVGLTIELRELCLLIEQARGTAHKVKPFAFRCFESNEINNESKRQLQLCSPADVFVYLCVNKRQSINWRVRILITRDDYSVTIVPVFMANFDAQQN